MRIEPSPSLPCAIGTRPGGDRRGRAAGRAAGRAVGAPRVAGRRRPASSVTAHRPSSGIRVTPTTTAPAPRSRRTTSWSSSATAVRAAAEPFQVGRPATGVFSLTATGTPASGRLARSSCSSTFSASVIASPPRTTRNAPATGSLIAIWSRWSATTWVADVSPRRTARAICFAVAPTQVVGRSCIAVPVSVELGLSRAPAPDRRADRRRVSMPTDSRTRSAGTSSGEPAALACVIRPGCSISDSTPPSDSARTNSFARLQISTACVLAAGRAEETMPPNRRICLAAVSCPGWLAGPGRAPRPTAWCAAPGTRRSARRCRSAGPSVRRGS